MPLCLLCNPCLVLKTRARHIVVSMNIGKHIYLLFIFTGKASLMVLMRTKKGENRKNAFTSFRACTLSLIE